MKIMKSFLMFSILPAAAFAQISQTFYSPAGQSHALDYASYSARTAIWGPAFTGVADDASALFSNPAGLSGLKTGQVGIHTYLGLLDAVGETAVLGLPVENLGGFGLAGSYMDYGTFEGRDSAGSLAPNYGVNRIGVQAGWGREVLRNVSLGAAVHFSQEDIAGGASNLLTADVGLLWKPAASWEIGLDYLPPVLTSPSNAAVGIFKVGASFQADLDASTRLLAAVGDSVQSNTLDYLQGGVEASYRSTYFLRAGYRFSFNDSGADGFSGFSAGAGVAFGNFSLDYAYTPAAWVSDTNRFSLTYFWGEKKEGSVSKMENQNMKTGVLSGPAMERNGRPSTAPTPVVSSAERAPVSAPAPVTVFAQPPQLEGNNSKTGPGGDSKRLKLHFDIPADYTSQANQLQAQGQLAQAVPLYQQALQEDPKDVHAWWGLGNAYFKLGKKSDAIPCFEKVLDLKPDDQSLAKWLEKYKAQQP